MVYLRKKEDPWNSVAAGAAAGGFLAMAEAALFSAAFGGVLLGFIEGIGIMHNSMNKEDPLGMGQPGGMQMELLHHPPQPQPQAAANSSAEGSSWGLGIFCRGNNGRKDELLEGFEIPSPPGMHPMLHFPEQVQQQQPEAAEGPPLLLKFFGWGKKQETVGGGSKTEVLESFDKPSQPMSYEYK